LNDNHPSFVPGYNLYIRLLAETGFIGLIIFLAILILSITMCLIAIYQKNKNHLIYLIVLTSLIGTGLNWLKVDSFRDYIFWINLALLIILTSSLSKSKILKNIESQNL
jgi:O-antigen ligase